MSLLGERARQLGSLWNELEKGLMVALVGVLVGFALLEIVLRNFFSTGLIWGEALLRHLVLWASLLGASRATSEDRHIHIDLLPKILPERYLCTLQIAGSVFPMVISAVLFWISLRFVMDERMVGGSAFLHIRSWWLELIFPICFALMTVRFGLRLRGCLTRSSTSLEP